MQENNNCNIVNVGQIYLNFSTVPFFILCNSPIHFESPRIVHKKIENGRHLFNFDYIFFFFSYFNGQISISKKIRPVTKKVLPRQTITRVYRARWYLPWPSEPVKPIMVFFRRLAARGAEAGPGKKPRDARAGPHEPLLLDGDAP